MTLFVPGYPRSRLNEGFTIDGEVPDFILNYGKKEM